MRAGRPGTEAGSWSPLRGAEPAAGPEGARLTAEPAERGLGALQLPS